MQDGTQQGLDPWLQEFEEAMRETPESALAMMMSCFSCRIC